MHDYSKRNSEAPVLCLDQCFPSGLRKFKIQYKNENWFIQFVSRKYTGFVFGFLGNIPFLVKPFILFGGLLRQYCLFSVPNCTVHQLRMGPCHSAWLARSGSRTSVDWATFIAGFPLTSGRVVPWEKPPNGSTALPPLCTPLLKLEQGLQTSAYGLDLRPRPNPSPMWMELPVLWGNLYFASAQNFCFWVLLPRHAAGPDSWADTAGWSTVSDRSAAR